MTSDTALRTLDYVESSGQALHAAQQLAEKVAADQQKVASLVPQHVSLLQQAGLISEGEKTAAASRLSSHEGTLAIVSNLVTLLGEQKQAFEQKLAAKGNGQSVPAAGAKKQAADAGTGYGDGGNVGRRRGAGEKSAADLALVKALGLEGRVGKRS